MDEVIKVFVGLDVHKDTIAMAVAEAGREPGRVIGTLPHDVNKLCKALAKLGRPEQVHVVYEAGPTGYGLQRTLAAKGLSVRGDRPVADPQTPWRVAGCRKPRKSGCQRALLMSVPSDPVWDFAATT